jgi:hypothetical protein
MPMSKTEAHLLELMRTDRRVQNQRQAEQAAVDIEAREPAPTIRIERVTPRRHREPATRKQRA